MLKKVILICLILITISLSCLLLVVRVRSISSEKIITQCSSYTSSDKIKCLLPYFKNLVYQDSVATAIKVAHDMFKSGYINDCHFAAHEIGHIIYDKDQDFGEALSQCTNECVQGCYHGVVERFLVSQNPSQDEIINSVQNLCSKVLNDELLYRQCIHGIGHGLMNIFFGNLDKSLNICSYLGLEWRYKTCSGGVFMEYVSLFFQKNNLSDELNLEDICRAIDPKIKDDCLSAIGEGLMFQFENDLDKSITFCNQLPKKDSSSCIIGARQQVEALKQ